MAAPTTQFKDIATSTATTDLDLKSERVTAAGSGTLVNDGGSNPWDFTAGDTLTVDISAGANVSPVRMIFWNVTANNGNTLVDNFKFWFSNVGFIQSASKLRYVSLSFGDFPTTANVDNVYVANAVTGSYKWNDADEGGTPPGSQNVFAADDTTSISIGTVPSEFIAIAGHFSIDAGEQTGTYMGTTANYEAQCSLKYDYS